jgi:hypothetical protein
MPADVIAEWWQHDKSIEVASSEGRRDRATTLFVEHSREAQPLL